MYQYHLMKVLGDESFFPTSIPSLGITSTKVLKVTQVTNREMFSCNIDWLICSLFTMGSDVLNFIC